jgi:tRNA A37 threonylcarbamoyladenosine biosynthesis protein TsaE
MKSKASANALAQEAVNQALAILQGAIATGQVVLIQEAADAFAKAANAASGPYNELNAAVKSYRTCARLSPGAAGLPRQMK